MEIRTVKELVECERLWKRFSDNSSLWDVWEVAFSFFDENNDEPSFIVLSDEGKDIGLLPLEREKKSGIFYYFGGGFPENRKFWFSPEHMNLFIESIKGPIKLFDLNSESSMKMIEANPSINEYLKEGDIHYTIDLKKLDSFEDYLKTFSKKHRHNFKSDIIKIGGYVSKEWKKMDNFDEYVSLSLKRFGNDSDLSDEVFRDKMRSFLQLLNDKFDLHTFVALKDNAVKGIMYAVFYNDIYYILTGANDIETKNVGKLVVYEHIRKACQLNAKKIDLLTGDHNWKELWNCEKDHYFSLTKE